MLNIESIDAIILDFKERCNIKGLNEVLNEINNKPTIISKDLKKNFSILVELFFQKDSKLNDAQILLIKNSVLDLFIKFSEYSDLSWYLVEHAGILSILFEEFYQENDNALKIKMLKCMEIYLLFENVENHVFGQCEDFCCSFGIGRAIGESKILETCQSIVKSLIQLENINSHQNGIENHLITLSLIYRRYSINLSPESCGDINSYKILTKLLFDVCQCDKYSSVSAISALSCFYRTYDPSSDKCFTKNNSEFTTSIIYEALAKSGSTEQYPACPYAVLLFNDVLRNDNVIEFIRSNWTVSHYKSICKLLVFEFPSVHYEKILQLFCTAKDHIPEWGIIIDKYLCSNSKFFNFLNSLTVSNSDRCSIMAWRLFKLYFQPTDIAEHFCRDYCLLLTTSVKSNLQSVQYPSVTDESSSDDLSNRNYMRCVTKASAAIDMLLMMAKPVHFSNHLSFACSSLQMMPMIENLVRDLIDGKHNHLLQNETCCTTGMTGSLCESQNWFVAASRLTVSLVYFAFSMASTFPNLFCKKNLNQVLVRPPFIKMLVTSMTHSTCVDVIERSVALMSVSSQFAEYDLSLLTGLIRTNTHVFYKNCQNYMKNNQTNTVASTNTVDETQLKYQMSVRKIIDSWRQNENHNFTHSDVTRIFAEEIKNLREHEAKLDEFIKEKDNYIRHFQELANQYRIKSMNSDVKFQTLMHNHADMQEMTEDQIQTISHLNERVTKHKHDIEIKDNELHIKSKQLMQLQKQLAEMEIKCNSVCEQVNDFERLNDGLRNELGKSQSELAEKNKEVAALKQIISGVSALLGTNANLSGIANGV